MQKYIKNTLVIISLSIFCCSCTTIDGRANKVTQNTSSSMGKKTMVGGITGATLGVAAGAGIAAACAFPPLALVVAPIAIIGLGTAGATGGALVGHHLEKADGDR